MKTISKVPVNHRILLHLKDYHRCREQFELPFALTQLGIAEEVLIHRAAAARSLNEMRESKLVKVETRHVIRGNRKRKVYFLTDEGFVAARELEKNLLETEVKVVQEGSEETRTIPLHKLVSRKQAGLTLVTACNYLQGGQIILPESPGQAKTAKPETGEKTERQGKKTFFSPSLPDLETFTGRTEELTHIVKLVESGVVSAIVLQGLAGIGKTSLAARVAQEFREKRSVLWLDIHSWESLGRFVGRLLDLLQNGEGQRDRLVHIAPLTSQDEELFGRLLDETLRELGSSNCLIVLDDVHCAAKVVLDFLRALLQGMRGIRGPVFLMTTRTMPSFYDQRLVVAERRIVEMSLTGLSFDDAYLLMRLLDQERTSRTKKESRPGSKMLEMTPTEVWGYLPSKTEFETIYQETLGHPFSLELLSSLGFSSARLDFQRFLKDEILEKLSQEERDLILFSSVFRLPLHMDLLLELVPNTRAARQHVELLIQKNLLRGRGKALTLHALVRDLARDRLSQEDRENVHHQAASYYQKLVQSNEELWPSNVGNTTSRRHLDELREREHAFLTEELHHLFKAGRKEEAAKKTLEIGDELISYGSLSFYELLQEIDIQDLEPGLARELLELKADAHAEFGRLDEALDHYLQRLEREDGDSLKKARLLQKMGELEREKGDIDSSIELRKRSLNIFQKRKSSRETARALNDLGLGYWKKKDTAKARQSFRKALKLLQQLGLQGPLHHVRLNLAQLESESGDQLEARRLLTGALSEARANHQRRELHHAAGDLARKAGDLPEALGHYLEGLKMARKERAFSEMMYFLENSSRLQQEAGEKSQALETLSSGIAFIEKEAGPDGEQQHLQHQPIPRESVGRSIRNRWTREPTANRIRNAKARPLSRAEEGLRRDNERFASLCEKAATFSQEKEFFQEAGGFFRKAALIHHNLGEPGKAATLLLTVGQEEAKRGALREAALAYNEAQLLFREAGNTKGQAISLLNLAGTLERLGKTVESRERLLGIYQTAEELAKKTGFCRAETIAKEKLAWLRSLDKGQPGN